MSFTSLAYSIFLPLVFCLYWLLGTRRRAWQNALLVLASYVFYGWWDARFLLLILFTTLCSFTCGWAIGVSEQHPRCRKWLNVTNIVANLLILAFFKYFNFFSESLADMGRLFGCNVHPVVLQLILPAGISFYTFQALSYTIDVYMRRIKPTSDLLSFSAYLCFFPQLVAGPIEKPSHLLPYFQQPRRFSAPEATEGLRLILLGLFKKMVIADNCAASVENIFSFWQQMDPLVLWVGALLFTLQIYCDFSGYSDIAIGSARLFGIRLTTNFRAPYMAVSIADFWRRWHITLQNWFRDYVYIPLGGSQRGQWRTYANIFIVFALSGLWHGAAWTFVCWGLYHAFLFLPFRFLSGRRLPVWLMRMLTFFCVVVGWVLFRSDSIPDALGYLSRMFSGSFSLALPPSATQVAIALGFGLLLSLFEYQTLPEGRVTDKFARLPWWCRRLLYLLMAWLIILLGAESSAFIYFQF
ncbi:MAG: MBOAT family protein [Bacteroidaceae bacterium]|nr:MBOAT family protein [Bacteroidaceae bacterium]